MRIQFTVQYPGAHGTAYTLFDTTEELQAFVESLVKTRRVYPEEITVKVQTTGEPEAGQDSQVRMKHKRDDPPKVGDKLKSRSTGHVSTVTDVFPAGQYPGMILEWESWNVSTGRVGRYGQAFTTKDWRDRWKVVRGNQSQREILP